MEEDSFKSSFQIVKHSFEFWVPSVGHFCFLSHASLLLNNLSPNRKAQYGAMGRWPTPYWRSISPFTRQVHLFVIWVLVSTLKREANVKLLLSGEHFIFIIKQYITLKSSSWDITYFRIQNIQFATWCFRLAKSFRQIFYCFGVNNTFFPPCLLFDSKWEFSPPPPYLSQLNLAFKNNITTNLLTENLESNFELYFLTSVLLHSGMAQVERQFQTFLPFSAARLPHKASHLLLTKMESMPGLSGVIAKKGNRQYNYFQFKWMIKEGSKLLHTEKLVSTF